MTHCGSQNLLLVLQLQRIPLFQRSFSQSCHMLPYSLCALVILQITSPDPEILANVLEEMSLDSTNCFWICSIMLKLAMGSYSSSASWTLESMISWWKTAMMSRSGFTSNCLSSYDLFIGVGKYLVRERLGSLARTARVCKLYSLVLDDLCIGGCHAKW